MDTAAISSRSAVKAGRWFPAAIVLLMVAIALLGFVPSSLQKIAEVQAGHRPPFPPILHVHAVLMGTWMSLLAAQALLVSSGRVALHRRLGLSAFALLPVLVLVMILMTREAWLGVLRMPPGAMPPEMLAATKTFLGNLLLGQIHSILFFPLFIGWALVVRKTDPATHKRFMIYGTMLPLAAGIDRFTGMLGASTLPGSGDSLYLWTLLLIAPVIAFDLIRLGRIHKASVIFTGVFLACFGIVHLLWGSPGWQALAPRVMGLLGVHGW